MLAAACASVLGAARLPTAAMSAHALTTRPALPHLMDVTRFAPWQMLRGGLPAQRADWDEWSHLSPRRAHLRVAPYGNSVSPPRQHKALRRLETLGNPRT